MDSKGMLSLLNDNVYTTIKGFFGEVYRVKMNWLQVFDYSSSLVAGAFTNLDTEGCGIYLFKLNTKTGELTSMMNLLEDEGDAKIIRDHLEF